MVAEEVRAAGGARQGSKVDDDHEGAWLLRSAMIHFLVRKHIHRTRVVPDLRPQLRGLFAIHLHGALRREAVVVG